MTSLANQAAFDRALAEAIALAQGQGAPLTLTLCSLDCFTSFVERFSIGVTAWVPGDDASNLIERARAGLGIAKKEGRNRVVEMNPQGAVYSAVRVA